MDTDQEGFCKEVERLAVARGYASVHVTTLDHGHAIGVAGEKGGLTHAVAGQQPVDAGSLIDGLDAWFAKKGVK